MRSEAEADVFERFASRFTATPVKSVDFVAEMLANAVKEAEERDRFVDVLITGLQGYGKSTLALYIMYNYYEYDIDAVLDNVFFSAEDLMLELAQNRRRLVLLDDAGVSLTKYRAMSAEAIDFVLFLNPVRTRLSGLLYTTVHDNLIRFARITAKYLVIMYEPHGDVAYGLLRKTFIGRSGTYKRDVCKFIMNFRELHSDENFHLLYTEYKSRSDQFRRSVNMQLLERIRERRKKTL